MKEEGRDGGRERSLSSIVLIVYKLTADLIILALCVGVCILKYTQRYICTVHVCNTIIDICIVLLHCVLPPLPSPLLLLHTDTSDS